MRDIIKAIFKTGSGSIITIILGMISVKIMAVVLGPNGLGLLSLIRQTLQTASITSTMGGGTALVQGIASKEGNEKDNYLITVFWIFVIGAISTSIVLLLFAPWIAKTIFATNDAQTIGLVRWMVLPVMLMAIYSYLTSVLNGFHAIGRLVIGQVIVSIVTVFLAYPISKLVSNGNTIAFIWMISVSTLGGLIFYLLIAYKKRWLNPLIVNFKPRFDKKALKHFWHISSTTLVTGLITTGTLLLLRVMIVRYGGLDSAGIFDVAWTLSMIYIMLVLGSFGTYYLPTLSGIKNEFARITLMQNILKISLIIVVPLIVTIIVLKPLVIHILYSNEFLPSLEIIRWMLIGDYFKVSSWIFSISVVAYANMKVFFWTELLWNTGFLLISSLALFYFKNMQGIGLAFIIMYFFYFVYYLYYVRSKHQFLITKRLLWTWLIGLVLIILASWQTWSDIDVNWISAPIWVGVAIGFSWAVLEKDEKSKLIKMIYKRGG